MNPKKNKRLCSVACQQKKAAGIPLIIGVTGGIACGKSLVVSQFKALGAAIISADDLAREAVVRGSETLKQIVAYFGSGVLNDNGELDRPILARCIFSDPEGRNKLNQIMYPVIGKLAEQQLRELVGRNETRLVVYEAPLLFEAKAEKRVDLVLVIVSSEEIQLQRLIRRDSLSREEAVLRIQSQIPLAEKIARADIILDNSGTPEDTIKNVRKLFTKLALPAKKIPR